MGRHQDPRQTPGAAPGKVGDAGQRAEGVRPGASARGADGKSTKNMEKSGKIMGKSKKIMGESGEITGNSWNLGDERFEVLVHAG